MLTLRQIVVLIVCANCSNLSFTQYYQGDNKVFSYFAYGLGIQSELPIPEFIPALVGHDVTIYFKQKDT